MSGNGCVFTSKRHLVKLVYFEEFSTRDEVFVIERKIKKWTRAKKEALIDKDWENVHLLAKRSVK